jgi:hypothetical protein
MGLVALPNSFANGTPNDGPQVRANDDAIVAQVNGNLDVNNVKPNAGLPGTVISNSAGSRIPTDRVEDGAITLAKLASNSVDTSKIVAGSVDVSRLGAQAVTGPKVKITSFAWSPGGSLAGGADNSISTGLDVANTVPLCITTELAGVPSTTTAKYHVNLHNNTATGKWHLVLQNAHDTTSVSLAAVTFRFYVIAAS